ncbi:MAG: hypothetical protein ACO1N0_14870 [Fluviicola sp.]
MKKSTRNKLNMYGSVLSVLNDHQPSWQAVSAFVNAKTAFETKLNQLRVRVTEQLGATTGVALEKKLRITDLRKRVLIVQHALFLLGRASGDVLLQERNSQTKTELERMALNELAARCAELKQDLDSYATQLAEYGITPQSIAELIPLLQGIDELNNSTRKAIIKRKGITQAIKDLEHELDELLRVELDRLILVFKQTDPAFYHAYESARIIIDYGSSKGSRGNEPENPGLAS